MWLDRIDPAFGHWFAGFVDGEGCFYIGRVVHHHRNGTDYVNYRCAFTIAVRDDDRGVIEEIAETLGFGRIVARAARTTTTFSGTGPMVAYEAGSKADVQRLVSLFDRFPLRAKKRRDYALWRDAVIEWSSKQRGGGIHRGRHDWSRMAALHEELKAVRKYT